MDEHDRLIHRLTGNRDQGALVATNARTLKVIDLGREGQAIPRGTRYVGARRVAIFEKAGPTRLKSLNMTMILVEGLGSHFKGRRQAFDPSLQGKGLEGLCRGVSAARSEDGLTALSDLLHTKRPRRLREWTKRPNRAARRSRLVLSEKKPASWVPAKPQHVPRILSNLAGNLTRP